MNGKIYHIDGTDVLRPLEEQPYATEELLQTFLARYPDLLAGEQVDREVPRRWLLVDREIGVPGEEGGGDRWSLDHLFLDQDGVPTLVEVKRSTDTRIRREVVGQMLDYAANAVMYWPAEALAGRFEATCAGRGDDAAEAVRALVGAAPDDDSAVEAYWTRVKTNLQAGRVRMVFVADRIPPELRRIVEFLNGQMGPAEVLAIELRQYVGEGVRTLVPRVIGQTAEAEQKRATAPPERRQWDEPSFLAELERFRGPEERAVAEDILRWSREHNLRVFWGKGKVHGSFFPMLDYGGMTHWLVSVWNRTGTVEVQFEHMRPPFDTELRKREVLKRLAAIEGLELSHANVNARPSLRLSALLDPVRRGRFLAVLEWILGEIRQAYGSA